MKDITLFYINIITILYQSVLHDTIFIYFMAVDPILYNLLSNDNLQETSTSKRIYRRELRKRQTKVRKIVQTVPMLCQQELYNESLIQIQSKDIIIYIVHGLVGYHTSIVLTFNLYLLIMIAKPLQTAWNQTRRLVRF